MRVGRGDEGGKLLFPSMDDWLSTVQKKRACPPSYSGVTGCAPNPKRLPELHLHSPSASNVISFRSGAEPYTCAMSRMCRISAKLGGMYLRLQRQREGTQATA